MLDLVLSNTTSFFSGNLEALFRNAKKYGFRYVEIIPYRWTRPEQILKWQEKYGVTVAGVHLPTASWDRSAWQEFRQARGLWGKFWTLVLRVYLGNAQASPGLKIASALGSPYVLIHQDVAQQMLEKFTEVTRDFHVVIENIPSQPVLAPRGVFDHGHFNESRRADPSLDIYESYRQAQPEVIHISYNSRFVHLLPGPQEQEELKRLLKLHQPRYVTIETNPLVSIRKGKNLLSTILKSLY